VNAAAPAGVLSGPGVFATTRWSLILSAADSTGNEQKAREAVAELCRVYWRPIFSFVARQGDAIENSQDPLRSNPRFQRILVGPKPKTVVTAP
jgi:hypothetical protein